MILCGGGLWEGRQPHSGWMNPRAGSAPGGVASGSPEPSALSPALPKPPVDLVVTETTATSVTLTWDSGNSEPVSYYGIQYRPAGAEGPFQEVDGVATTRYSIGGLSPFSEYAFRVLAVNSIGRGPPSEAVRARTGEQAPSSPPRRVQARMLSASTMLVQWEPPEEPNGLVRGYRVYYTPDSRRPLSAWHKHNTDAGLLTTVGSLLPGITYSLRVLAFTAVGDGPPSPTIQVKTQQGGRCRPGWVVRPLPQAVSQGLEGQSLGR